MSHAGGVALIVLGGFLLGGAYSVFGGAGRRRAGTVGAVVLLVAGLLALAAGLLRLR